MNDLNICFNRILVLIHLVTSVWCTRTIPTCMKLLERHLSNANGTSMPKTFFRALTIILHSQKRRRQTYIQPLVFIYISGKRYIYQGMVSSWDILLRVPHQASGRFRALLLKPLQNAHLWRRSVLDWPNKNISVRHQVVIDSRFFFFSIKHWNSYKKYSGQ